MDDRNCAFRYLDIKEQVKEDQEKELVKIMSYLEKEAVKRRTDDVYSRSCEMTWNNEDNGGWPARDDLPTGDPIGDIVELELSEVSPDDFVDAYRYAAIMEENYPEEYKGDLEMYKNTMLGRLISPEGKVMYGDLRDFGYSSSDKPKTCCDNPQKYKNVISSNMKFWSCKNCGADLGDA